MLAGGFSTRMEFPKLYLDYGGIHFIEKICSTFYESGFHTIMVVLNDALSKHPWQEQFAQIPSYVTVVLNEHPEKGRMHSIQLGIKALQQSNYCFIHNSDNPFVTRGVIEQLWELRSEKASVIPSYQLKGGHPILIPKVVMHEIEMGLEDALTLKEVLSKHPCIYSSCMDEGVVQNVNTKDDYARILHSTIEKKHE